MRDLGAQQDAVLWSIRLPRVMLGALVGAALGIAGAAYQGIVRNPLADPQLIGVSSGAALGSALGILTFGWLLGTLAGQVGGFLGGLAAGAAVSGNPPPMYKASISPRSVASSEEIGISSAPLLLNISKFSG